MKPRSARAGEHEHNADGEPAEVRRLLGYGHASESTWRRLLPGMGLTGAAAELGAALEVPTVGASGGVAVPWAVLAGPSPAPERRREQDPERRAFTDTGDYAGAE